MPQADASSLDCFLLAQAPVFDTSWFGFRTVSRCPTGPGPILRNPG